MVFLSTMLMVLNWLWRASHTGVWLEDPHDRLDAAREIPDPDRAYAWNGRVDAGAYVAWSFEGQAGERFRARVYVPIEQPTAERFHPALILAVPDDSAETTDLDLGLYSPPALPRHQVNAWIPHLTDERPERSFHSGVRYLQGVGFDLTLPTPGRYFLLVLANDVGGQFMLGTGWREG